MICEDQKGMNGKYDLRYCPSKVDAGCMVKKGCSFEMRLIRQKDGEWIQEREETRKERDWSIKGTEGDLI